jgi:NADH-quinone oxidoreductase subunit M
MWPFHTWLPDAHVEAPTAGSVILAAVLLKMGTYGFVRYSLPMFPEASKYYVPLIFFLSVVAIIYAAMMAIAQTHIKRLIAYSSISHMGLVTLATFASDGNALNGAIYMMVAHGLSSAALFMSAGFIYDRIHSYHMDDLGGLARYIPNLAIVFMLSGLVGIGFPGLAGFVAEFLILLGTYKNYPVWAFVAGVGMVLGAAYFLYMYKRVMLEEETISDYRREKWSHLKDLELHHWIAFVLVLASSVLLGVYPLPFVKLMEHTTKMVLEVDMNWNALLPELVLSFGILLLFFLDLLLDKRHFRLLNVLGGFVPIFAFISLFFVKVPEKTFFDTSPLVLLSSLGRGFCIFSAHCPCLPFMTIF